MCLLLLLSGCTESGGETAAPAPEIPTATAERGPVRVELRAGAGEITVGEKLTLTLDVQALPGVEVTMPQIEGELGVFTVRSGRHPPDVPEGGVRRWTHAYVLDTFRPGETEIEVPPVAFTDRRPEAAGADGAPIEGDIAVEPIRITVRSVLTADEAAGGLRDIRGVVEVPVAAATRRRRLGLMAGALVVIGAVVVLVVLLRRRRRPAAAPPAPAHVWALGALERLEAEQLIEARRFHDFYYRLSDIVRQYVERRFSIMAPEQTTDEFLRAARDTPWLSDGHRRLLAEFLRAADMVKFARFEPSDAESRDAFTAARGFVEQTTPAPARPEGSPGGAPDGGASNGGAPNGGASSGSARLASASAGDRPEASA